MGPVRSRVPARRASLKEEMVLRKVKIERCVIYIIVLGIVFLVEALYVLNCMIPHYRYYADYVDECGVPKGVVELTKKQRVLTSISEVR